MKKTSVCLTLACLLVSGGASMSGSSTLAHPTNTEISLETLQGMFHDMRDKNGWNVDAPLVWDYFFTSHDRKKLLAAVPLLERKGYRVIGILEPTPQDDDQGLLFLQVEKIETHTPTSLYARNKELYRFADEHGLESYDGMDAGPVPGHQ